MAKTPLLLDPTQLAVVALLVGKEKGHWTSERFRMEAERARMRYRQTISGSTDATNETDLDNRLRYVERRIEVCTGILKQINPDVPDGASLATFAQAVELAGL